MRYCPNDESLLFMRGLCFYKLGNIDEAQKDWERIAKLGGDISLDLIDYDLSQMEDYNEMLEILAEINN
ncbi:tetratricopeptide repeat protein [Prolixibacteraceae bacterium Z1-6]|uniref:Tetratricopeptide repeat protein n=1 Tax=Draconibacterium aestuarii TaxID=2998507 RepID=A0A9X3J357_9BACT|nr:tetratricopeptide repeat protein [Prolixibacteraceae bacterium Z1-6]